MELSNSYIVVSFFILFIAYAIGGSASSSISKLENQKAIVIIKGWLGLLIAFILTYYLTSNQIISQNLS